MGPPTKPCADRNTIQCPDAQGRVPLWEALSRGHRGAAQLLADGGADLASGDAELYARAAVEAGDVALLEDVARHGGDVTVACCDDGGTALHRAVLQGDVGMARALLEHGADADREDGGGRTPRDLAGQLGHRDMHQLFGPPSQSQHREAVESPIRRQGSGTEDHGSSCRPAVAVAARPAVTRFKSAPAARVPVAVAQHDGAGSSPSPSSSRHSSPRRMVSFRNSLFGVLSSSQVNRHDGAAGGGGHSRHERHTHSRSRVRVTVSCPEQGVGARKLVFMPETMAQLVELAGSQFGFAPTRVVTTDGAQVDDARLVRDGDHLLVVTHQWQRVPDTKIVHTNQ